jgi:hypothetical protein
VTPVFPCLAALARDTRGTALIETALLAPALIVMCVGGFEVSAIVARQSELQSTAEQATEIALATNPDTDAELTAIEDVLESTGDLQDAQVTLSYRYRCGASTTVSTVVPTCDEDQLSTYIHITMTDTYVPVWSEWGFGEGLDYEIIRTVQVS